VEIVCAPEPVIDDEANSCDGPKSSGAECELTQYGNFYRIRCDRKSADKVGQYLVPLEPNGPVQYVRFNGEFATQVQLESRS